MKNRMDVLHQLYCRSIFILKKGVCLTENASRKEPQPCLPVSSNYKLEKENQQEKLPLFHQRTAHSCQQPRTLQIVIYRTNASIIYQSNTIFYTWMVYLSVRKKKKKKDEKIYCKGPFEDKHNWSSWSSYIFNNHMHILNLMHLMQPWLVFTVCAVSLQKLCSFFCFFYSLHSSRKLKTLILNLNPLGHTCWQTALLLEHKLNQRSPSTGLPKAFHLLPLCITLLCLQLSISGDIKTLFHMLLLASSLWGDYQPPVRFPA